MSESIQLVGTEPTELVPAGTTALAAVSMAPIDVAGLVQRKRDIQEVMTLVMKDGTHYGKIPGCGDKPTLFQAGADTLAVVFQLVPRYTVELVELEGQHREYRTTCTMLNGGGKYLGQGFGSASTKEAKWRYRTDYLRRAVPDEYWKNRDPETLGGPEFGVKKNDNRWSIVRRTEHQDVADVYNTVLKIACKRAFVMVVRSVTGSSDLFAQDLEDLERTIDDLGGPPPPVTTVTGPPPDAVGKAVGRNRPRKPKAPPEPADPPPFRVDPQSHVPADAAPSTTKFDNLTDQEVMAWIEGWRVRKGLGTEALDDLAQDRIGCDYMEASPEWRKAVVKDLPSVLEWIQGRGGESGV